MQAIQQPAPIAAELQADEAPIFPAVMDGAGGAALYTWRATGGGTALWRRLFSGQLQQPGRMTQEALGETVGHPVVSGAGAVPGEPTRHAVLGWVEDGAEGARLGLAIIRDDPRDDPRGDARGDRLRVIRSEPLAGMAAVARQRLGVWAASLDRIELAAVLETRGPPGGYALARFSLAASWPESRVVTRTPLPLAPGTLHAAAIDYYKNNLEPRLHQTLLRGDGALLTAYGADQPLRIERQGVPLDDPLAVVTVTAAAFRGVRPPAGGVIFERF
jgi:hypothetical protein